MPCFKIASHDEIVMLFASSCNFETPWFLFERFSNSNFCIYCGRVTSVKNFQNVFLYSSFSICFDALMFLSLSWFDAFPSSMVEYEGSKESQRLETPELSPYDCFSLSIARMQLKLWYLLEICGEERIIFSIWR